MSQKITKLFPQALDFNQLPAAVATGLTGFDLYLLRGSTVEEFPDSVVLKEPVAAAIVDADVVV